MDKELAVLKKNKTLVIAIPTLNSENTLPITMDSIAIQKNHNFNLQVVLLDSGSILFSLNPYDSISSTEFLYSICVLSNSIKTDCNEGLLNVFLPPFNTRNSLPSTSIFI